MTPSLSRLTRRKAALAAAALRSPTVPGNRSRIAESMASRVISPVSAAKPPSSAAFGKRPAELLEGELGGRAGEQAIAVELVEELAEPELVEVLRRIDEDVALRGEPGEEIDLVDQCDVLDDERVGCHDRLAGADGSGRRSGRTRRRARPCVPSRSSGTPARDDLRRTPPPTGSRRRSPRLGRHGRGNGPGTCCRSRSAD